MKSTLVAGLVMMVAACGDPGQALDSERAGDIGEVLYAADTGGISEGGKDAAGVLKVANTLSRSDLQSRVGLTSTVANNIANYRLGDDTLPGTADDEVFDTLRELDGIPYVNAAVFGKLLSYARANGYVSTDLNDPFDAANCTGPDISDSELVALFAPGQTLRRLAFDYTVKERVRSCIGTACTGWSMPSRSAEIIVDLELSKTLSLQVRCGGGFLSSGCSGIGTSSVTCRAFPSDPVCPEVAGDRYRFTGKMTKNCLRLSTPETGTRQTGFILRF